MEHFENRRSNFQQSKIIVLLIFQQKTSTVDDSKDDCGLFEAECIFRIQGSNFKDSITHDFSDSSLCINNENTYPELLGSSVGGNKL